MTNRLACGLISLSLLTAGAATTHLALAQTAAPVNGDAAASGEGLAEIVVTAQRREETAQRAAIAISTVSGAAITEANVTRPGGLSDLVPALQATDDTGP